MDARSIISAPVTVPAGFVGVCTHDLANAPEAITHGLVRNWDYRGTQGVSKDAIMTYINPSAGVYSWATFDELLASNPGKGIIFVLGNPPDYMVARAATGSAYRGTKGNMCPDDLSAWATAVQAVVSRAKNTHGRTGLRWELWNEIDQVACYNDSIALLGPYTKATAQAIKAVDPTANVLSPSIAGKSAVATLKAYLSTSDGAGGTVASWIDGISFHYYNQTLSIRGYEHPINYYEAWAVVQGTARDLGIDKPIYVTESGVIAADTQGGIILRRRLLVWAALGCKCMLAYSYDTASYPIATYLTQWNEVANLLNAGAVIDSLILGVGSLQVSINGTAYEF